MNNFLIEYKKQKNKKNIIEHCLQEIKNLDILNTSVQKMYNFINYIQKTLRDIL